MGRFPALLAPLIECGFNILIFSAKHAAYCLYAIFPFWKFIIVHFIVPFVSRETCVIHYWSHILYYDFVSLRYKM